MFWISPMGHRTIGRSMRMFWWDLNSCSSSKLAQCGHADGTRPTLLPCAKWNRVDKQKEIDKNCSLLLPPPKKLQQILLRCRRDWLLCYSVCCANGLSYLL